VREFLTELRPVLEGVAVARHEIAVVTVDVGEGSEPVVLHLEEPIRMIEGFRQPQERHGPECRSLFWADAYRRRAGGRHPSIVRAPNGNSNSTALVGEERKKASCAPLGLLSADPGAERDCGQTDTQ
jgi:hypothetical protein